MKHHVKNLRTVVVQLDAAELLRLTGVRTDTRIIVQSVRADGDRGIIVELVETAQVLEVDHEI
jgi:hypothetical protein